MNHEPYILYLDDEYKILYFVNEYGNRFGWGHLEDWPDVIGLSVIDLLEAILDTIE